MSSTAGWCRHAARIAPGRRGPMMSVAFSAPSVRAFIGTPDKGAPAQRLVAFMASVDRTRLEERGSAGPGTHAAYTRQHARASHDNLTVSPRLPYTRFS